MSQALKAVYRSAIFILQTACNLPKDVEVELFVQSSLEMPILLIENIVEVNSK